MTESKRQNLGREYVLRPCTRKIMEVLYRHNKAISPPQLMAEVGEAFAHKEIADTLKRLYSRGWAYASSTETGRRVAGIYLTPLGRQEWLDRMETTHCPGKGGLYCPFRVAAVNGFLERVTHGV